MNNSFDEGIRVLDRKSGTPHSELDSILKLSDKLLSGSSNSVHSNLSVFKRVDSSLPWRAEHSTNQKQTPELVFTDAVRTDRFDLTQTHTDWNKMQSKALEAKSLHVENLATENSHRPRRPPLLLASSIPSSLFPNDSSDNKIIQEKLKQQEEIIRHQKVVNNQLKLQLDQISKELKRTEEALNVQKLAETEARVEADRRVNLLTTLTRESASKDAMLRQLDSALGRLTAGWQRREQQRQNEMNELKSSEEKLLRELEESRRRLDAVQNEHEERLKQQRTDWNKTISDLQTECARYRSNLRSVESNTHELREQIKQLERSIGQKDQEIKTSRDQLMQATQKVAQLQSENSQLHDNFKQHISEAQLTLKRESKLRRQELKSLQTQMKQVVENSSKDQEELQRKLNEYYEEQLRKYSTERDRQFQDELTRLQETARTELREASDRYRAELEQLRLSAQTELARHLTEADSRLEAERRRVEWTEKQVERWRLSSREAEEARSMLASRLNELLQSRCMEAMQMLSPKPTEGLCRTRLTTSWDQLNSTRLNMPIDQPLHINAASAASSPRPQQFITQASMEVSNSSLGRISVDSIKQHSKSASPRTHNSDEEQSCATVVDRSEPTQIHNSSGNWRVASDSSEEANESSGSQEPICV
ncbi:hypothetical protein FGIG_02028 [Fasciola gigantica]|uniref:Uncharacterized protein n=1 Tax=Fasciola gigantica TaxID=46835 RepID=A0A504YK15_FASGI|nr:hypothetical protein FGIG_02028 [Fasciola gigantica]